MSEIFLKKLCLLAVLLLLMSCQDSKTDPSEKLESEATDKQSTRNDEIFIQLIDSTEPFSTNIRLDEFQKRPDLMVFGKNSGRQSLTIPTKNDINLMGGYLGASYNYNLSLERGDSLKIDLESISLNEEYSILIPMFYIPNSNRTWHEINFPNLLFKRNIRTKAIGIDSTKSFLFTYWRSEAMYNDAMALLDSLEINNLISADFFLEESNFQKYEFFGRRVREEAVQVEDSAEVFSFVKQELDLKGSKPLKSPAFVMLLRQLVEKMNNIERKNNSEKFDFVNEKETFLSADPKTAVLDSYLKSIYSLEESIFPAYKAKFDGLHSDDGLKEKWSAVLSDFQKSRDKLITTDRNIALLTNLVNDNELTFEEILEGQKGKVVLVDFWASWCAPCRNEMPYLKALKLQFEESELQIIEISIDTDYRAWERASKLENLSREEHNYIISNWEISKLYQTYDIKSIPRYLLFSSEGKIVSEDAPRPSNKKLIELIKANIK